MTVPCEICKSNEAVVWIEVAPGQPWANLCEQCEARLEEPREALLERLIQVLRRLFGRE